MLIDTIKSVTHWFNKPTATKYLTEERKGAEWVLFEFFINNQSHEQLEEYITAHTILFDRTAFDHGVVRGLRLIKEVEIMREYYETRIQ